MSEKKLIGTSAWAENDPGGLLDFAGSSKCVASEVYLPRLSRYQFRQTRGKACREGSMGGGMSAETKPACFDGMAWLSQQEPDSLAPIVCILQLRISARYYTTL